ncbi:hypothetical protein EPUS_03677 [Endocarpon pusillum Z07020]|uniref:F-box domain-containing protein n=1 Tax=Endocarpon pusillum (strain Z07020 / HMAS-L-300199) TaxID=1263415 RepID=U1HHQ7_ENDPU|nr:uncharacterized protein EPUS_03677 [Endocarpon pusillum Z07020]ERF69685.1 hypothetical protein EPUS_03677 [Endocarpon pusillum Z07020]
MKPLKTFNLLEEDDVDGDTEDDEKMDRPSSPHITDSVLGAICRRHCNTLQHLTMRCDYIFDAVVSNSILTSLVTRATSLKTLTMIVFGCDPDFLEHLPRSLQILVFILLDCELPAFGEADLIELHSKLPQLQKISYKDLRISVQNDYRNYVAWDPEGEFAGDLEVDATAF